MLQQVTDAFISGVELLEAEGRLARFQAARFAAGIAVFVALLVACLAGVGLLIAAAVVWLASIWGAAASLAFVGAAIAGLAGVAACAVFSGLKPGPRLSGE